MLLSADAAWLLVGALLLDALIGDPDWLWRRVPHPARMLGGLIAGLDQAFNRPQWTERRRRLAGAGAVALLLVLAAALAVAIESILLQLPFGQVLLALVASIFMAQRSLYEHVRHVRCAFASGGLEAARAAVSRIVGRDPRTLDEAGVCRAAIESCAENFSDGVVAPAFWFALLGLPGLVAYKAVNTADSMIGHRTARHRAFGWAAARLDDGLNLIPARLSGLLLGLGGRAAGGSVAAALGTMWRDAGRHRSPNAGWPEAAMAGALDLSLAGPRFYGRQLVDDPFLNAGGRAAARPADIGRALRVLVAACLLHAALYAALALVL